MDNPFLPINNRLANLEGLTLEVLQLLRTHSQTHSYDLDVLLTPQEAAHLLKISKVTLWAWEKKKIVQGRHIGNLKRFSRNELLTIGALKGGVTR